MIVIQVYATTTNAKEAEVEWSYKDLQDLLVQFSSVQSLSRVWRFVTPWTAARQASLSITNSWSPPKPMSIESVMPFNHLILCHPLLLLPPILPSIRVFSNESALCIRWPSRTNTPLPPKKALFLMGDWNAKVGSQEIPGVTGKLGHGVQNEAEKRLTEFCQENTLVTANTLFQQHKRRLYMDINRWSIPKSDWLHSFQLKMEKLFTVSKK